MASQTEPSVKISSLLNTKRILIVKKDISKNSLIENLVSLMVKDYPQIKKEVVLEKIIQREQGISTTLDTGLSIPHARIENIKDFLTALAVIPNGLADSAGQSSVIKAMFLFLSPSDSKFFQKHLKLLSVLSSMFKPEFIEKLNTLKTPKQIINEISKCKL
jgi:PTS system nitrogen regulatory IIA component